MTARTSRPAKQAKINRIVSELQQYLPKSTVDFIRGQIVKSQCMKYTQPINHPRFICSNGCHLTDEEVQKYGEGIRRAVLRRSEGSVATPQWINSCPVTT